MNVLKSFNLLADGDITKFLKKTVYTGVTEFVITSATTGTPEAIASAKLIAEYHLDPAALGLKTTAGYTYKITIPAMNKDGTYKVQIKVTATVNIDGVATKLTESIAPADINYAAHGIDYNILVKKIEEALKGIDNQRKELSIHSETGASFAAVTYTDGGTGNTEFTSAIAGELNLDSLVGVPAIPY